MFAVPLEYRKAAKECEDCSKEASASLNCVSQCECRPALTDKRQKDAHVDEME